MLKATEHDDNLLPRESRRNKLSQKTCCIIEENNLNLDFEVILHVKFHLGTEQSAMYVLELESSFGLRNNFC